MKLYDTSRREVVEITPFVPGVLKIYACGPTVYRDAHVGNMRTFLLTDLIKRFAQYQGLNVELIQNITDVGHMADDTGLGGIDEGQGDTEDRVLAQAKTESVDALSIARKYEDNFHRDLKLLNIQTATFTDITRAFESKIATVARDTSDRDSGAGPRTYRNVVGASQPDAIAGFKYASGNYFITANEGDAREYTCLNDDLRAASLKVDTRRFPDWTTLSGSAALGRAKVNPNNGDKDGDGDIDTIHLRGSNSMTMYRNGLPIWDSGDLLDQIQTLAFGVANINGSHSYSSDKSTMNYVGQDRSDDKGAEPEGVALGMVGDRRIAILGLERMTALAIFDITQPRVPVFQEWLQMLPTKATPAKDVKHFSPEGIVFVPADKSPSGKALIITSYELSGSISIHQIELRN